MDGSITAEMLTLSFVSECLGPHFTVPGKSADCHLLHVFEYNGADAQQVRLAAKRLIRVATLPGLYTLNKHRDMPHVVTCFKRKLASGGFGQPITMPDDAVVPPPDGDNAVVVNIADSDTDDDDTIQMQLAALLAPDLAEQRIAAAVADAQARREQEINQQKAQAAAKAEEIAKLDRKRKRAEMKQQLKDLLAAEGRLVNARLAESTQVTPQPSGAQGSLLSAMSAATGATTSTTISQVAPTGPKSKAAAVPAAVTPQSKTGPQKTADTILTPPEAAYKRASEDRAAGNSTARRL